MTKKFSEWFKEHQISDQEWAKVSERDKAFFGNQKPLRTPKNAEEYKESFLMFGIEKLKGMKQSGVVNTVIWQTFERDSCDACREMNGAIIQLDEAEIGKNLPPYSKCQNVNSKIAEYPFCRCGFAPHDIVP